MPTKPTTATLTKLYAGEAVGDATIMDATNGTRGASTFSVTATVTSEKAQLLAVDAKVIARASVINETRQLSHCSLLASLPRDWLVLLARVTRITE